MNTDRVPVGLEQVRAELDAWRGQRRKGDRIPEEVWRRAAGAVRRYGLNTVSRALRLDYYHLKRRADRGPALRQASPVFVELGTQATEAQTSLPHVIVRPEWVCAEVLVGQEDSGFDKSTAAGLRPENGHGTFLP